MRRKGIGGFAFSRLAARSQHMKAMTFHGPGDLRVERVVDPVLLAPTDALVRVQLAAICGSDVYVWHGCEIGLDPGTVMDNE